MKLPSSAPALLQESDDDDDDALHRGIEIHADDAGQVEDVADDREQDGADHGASDPAFAPLQRRTADDHRGNRLQLPQKTA